MQYDFPVEIAGAVGVAAIFPVTLLIATRLPALRGRNAAQFSAAVLIQVVLWMVVSLVLPDAYRPRGAPDWLLGTMILAGAVLFWLEAWALISRGYTLAMLLTLLRSAKVLDARAIAEQYRDGAGLEWILQHRVGGLEAAGLVRREDRFLVLTRPLGTFVAVTYRIAIVLLGLRKTG